MRDEPRCELCEDTGWMTWQQPVPGPDGALTLTQMSHPCVNGCSGWWKVPAAEQGTVVFPSAEAMATGHVAQANQQQRSDWSLPRRSHHHGGPRPESNPSADEFAG